MHALIPLLTVALGAQDLPIAPSGFRQASEVEIYRLGRLDYLTDVDYEVTLVNDKVRVETRVDFVARERKEAEKNPALDPVHKIDLGQSYGIWNPGDGVKVSDGWLQGWDMGEFGGGLYWFSKGGKRFAKIDRRNTSSVTRAAKGVYAWQGSDHMMFRYSRFVRLEYAKEEWSVHLVSDLHEVPRALIFNSDHFLYVGTEYVSTMELNGTQRLIYRSPRELRPGGFYKRRNGELWLGTSRAILCLSPVGNRNYKPFWFRPIEKQDSPGHSQG